MLKKDFINTIRIYGTPKHIAVEKDFYPFDNCRIALHWNQELNKEIVEKKLLGEQPYYRNWSAKPYIILKQFRHNGSPTPAHSRALQYKHKLEKWIEEYLTKE